MTAREHAEKSWRHLADHHAHSAQHAAELSVHHAQLAEAHRKLAKANDENGNEEIAPLYFEVAAHHKTLSTEYAKDAAHHRESQQTCDRCAKGIAEVADATRKAMGMADEIVPDHVRGSIPSNVPAGVTAVPRAGQPVEYINKRDVPPEFEKFVELGDIF